jgi:hypothetical protein
MENRFPILNVIEKPYYFGIGGIGDFLLLMSTFYDNVQSGVNTDVIFVANNVNQINRIAHLFPLINKFWLYPRKAFDTSEIMWNEITKSGSCLGTGVTPQKFDYIRDWIKCGETNVFDYYGVKKNPAWARRIGFTSDSVVIQPFGGDGDATKKKEISFDCLIKEMRVAESLDHSIVLIGSKEDTMVYPQLDMQRWNKYGVRWVVDFKQTFDEIIRCKYYVGTDSWGKTLSGLSGVSTKIYPNEYDKPLEDMFGHPVDPSDYVFLTNWGFEYASN